MRAFTRSCTRAIALAALSSLAFGSCPARPGPAEAAGIRSGAAADSGAPQAPCSVDGRQWGYRLGPHLALLEDPAGELGPEAALGPELAASYVPRSQETISLGYSTSTWWFKGSVRNDSGRDLRCFLVLKEPAIESVELFQGEAPLRAGAIVPVEARSLPSREPLFRLALPAGAEVPVLLRVRTDTSINLSFLLFEEDAYRRREAAAAFLSSACFGALLFAILYNAFLALSLRDMAYGFYTLVIAGILLNRLLVLGYFQFYFAPASGRWNYYSILLSTTWFTAAMAFFNTRFLSTAGRTPVLRLLNLAIPICAAANLAVLALSPHLADQLTIVLLLAAALVSIATGSAAWARGFRPARFYLLAWAALFLVAGLHGLGLFGIVAYSIYSDEALLVGTVAMSLLMSLALGDRINAMRREKERAQAAAIEAQRVLNEELEKQVRDRTALLARANDELELLSTTDRLTGIANRMKLERELAGLLQAGADRPLSAIMVDVDHFKRVNDDKGHLAGDEVLSQIAELLSRGTRASDKVGRWGGEEFLILCPDTGREGAAALAEKLRRAVEERDFPAAGRRMTCSFGVGAHEAGASADALVRLADVALYEAKRKGRNRVEVAPDDITAASTPA